ncbi:MAG: hypothetical protein HC904_03200 [Blastochloris sp.]|nr:hypothetical protein [Blastochloris sp.]
MRLPSPTLELGMSRYDLFKIWDEAPAEWYIIFALAALIGLALLYAVWKSCQEQNPPDDQD